MMAYHVLGVIWLHKHATPKQFAQVTKITFYTTRSRVMRVFCPKYSFLYDSHKLFILSILIFIQPLAGMR